MLKTTEHQVFFESGNKLILTVLMIVDLILNCEFLVSGKTEKNEIDDLNLNGC